jgi:spore maturation protein CgeB
MMDDKAAKPPRIVFLGLSITSSWGNGHATTYRSLMRELVHGGCDVLFLERDTEWYAAHRDMPCPPFGKTVIYESLSELKSRFAQTIRDADLVVVGSYVPEGIEIGTWVTRIARGVTAFYDIDTPVTLEGLGTDKVKYLSRGLIRRYQLYLSFTGGPVLSRLEKEYGSPMARALYCSVDPSLYYPEPRDAQWELGYMGTYSEDRQPVLDRLLVEPARRRMQARFVVAGAQYPSTLYWPRSVTRIEHVSPAYHRAFYTAQRFTLNVTRASMVGAGYSPSVRLFEAAACGTPIISDRWKGLDTFFESGREILVASTADEVLHHLDSVSESERLQIAARAAARVASHHTSHHRAAELRRYVQEVIAGNQHSEKVQEP